MPDPGRRCEARRKDGQPCRGAAVTGTQPGRCRLHIGRSKAATSAIAEAGRMVRAAGSHLHPIDHLLDCLYRAAAEVEVWGQMVADLDNAGEVGLGDHPGRLRGYAEIETVYDGAADKYRREMKHDPLLVRGAENTVQLHPFILEYDKALERRAKFAKMAMDAGVAERQVHLAEQQATLLAGAVRSILTELGVKLDRKAVGVVQRNLRSLAAAAPPELPS